MCVCLYKQKVWFGPSPFSLYHYQAVTLVTVTTTLSSACSNFPTASFKFNFSRFLNSVFRSGQIPKLTRAKYKSILALYGNFTYASSHSIFDFYFLLPIALL